MPQKDNRRCPICMAGILWTERCLEGNSGCHNGHKFKSIKMVIIGDAKTDEDRTFVDGTVQDNLNDIFKMGGTTLTYGALSGILTKFKDEINRFRMCLENERDKNESGDKYYKALETIRELAGKHEGGADEDVLMKTLNEIVGVSHKAMAGE